MHNHRALYLTLTIISLLPCHLPAKSLDADYSIELKNNQDFVINLPNYQQNDGSWALESYDPGYLAIVAAPENKKTQEESTSWVFYTKKPGATWLIFKNTLNNEDDQQNNYHRVFVIIH